MNRQAYMKAYWTDYRSRKKLVKFWVDLDTAADLKRLALTEGKRPAEIARLLTEAGLKASTYVPRHIERELKELNRLLKNVANNLNQQTRYAHKTRWPVDPLEVLSHVRRMHDHVNAYTLRQLLEPSSQPQNARQKHVP